VKDRSGEMEILMMVLNTMIDEVSRSYGRE